MMSASEPRISSADSVQTTDEGTQSTRFRSTFRLKMWVNRTCGNSPLQRMRATDCPTVPKPSNATREMSGDTVLLAVTGPAALLPTRILHAVSVSVLFRRSFIGFERHLTRLLFGGVRLGFAPCRVGVRAGGRVLIHGVHNFLLEKQKGHHRCWVMALLESLAARPGYITPSSVCSAAAGCRS